MSSVNLQELRPQFERELGKVGAVIEVCTPNQLQFVGGTIPWRPLIILRGGIVEASSGSHLICRARISASTAFLPLLAAITFWPLSLVSSFFIPVAALLSLAVAVVLVGAWGQANTWLNSLIERVVAQQGVQADGPASGRSAA